MSPIKQFAQPSKEYKEIIKTYYSKILSHEITFDGKYLLAPVKDNQLTVFPIEYYLQLFQEYNNLEDGDDLMLKKPKQNLPISTIPVNNTLCLCFLTQTNTQYKFALGGQGIWIMFVCNLIEIFILILGNIRGYKLSTDNIQECTTEWDIYFPNQLTSANALILQDNYIVAGCSDNNIYIYDHETQKHLITLTGHQDYIHDLKCPKNVRNIFYSAGEDGSVRCWDSRCSDSTTTLFPFKYSNISRPQFGKWIGAVDVSPNNEWLICGGGPSLSMWHVRSGNCAHIINTSNVIYATKFLSNNEDVMAAGSDNIITVWKRSEPNNVCQISPSIETIYSIAHHHYSQFNYNLFSFAGRGSQIEISNGKFIDWELSIS